MNDDPELLPCPFCGEERDVELQPTRNGMMRVYCDNCGCSGYETDARNQAIASWNQRVDKARIAELEAENRKLKEQADDLWMDANGFDI